MLIFFLLFTSALALQTFHTNCSLPVDTVSFVTAPNTRGTLDILWSCLATIIACIYTVLHLNIPNQERDPGWRGELIWQLKNTMQSLVWALITALAPELTLTIAIINYLDARHHATGDWTIQHMLLAGMGAYVDANGYHITSSELRRLIDDGNIGGAPKMDTRNDMLGKLVAIFQVCYFVLTTIVRRAQGLAISQLEIGTCSFVPMAVAIWFFSMLKPRGMTSTIQVIETMPEEWRRQRRDTQRPGNFYYHWHGNSGSYMPNGIMLDIGKNAGLEVLLLPAFTPVLGGIHLLAWNLPFPSYTELMTWRASSIVVTTAGLSLWLVLFLLRDSWKSPKERKAVILLGLLLVIISMGGYIAARLYLIIEMFRTLGFLEPSAYIATWTSNVPSIG